MSKLGLTSLIKQNPNTPTNGYTNDSYRNTNVDSLNESFIKNSYPYNIWLTENQCGKFSINVVDKNNPSFTVDRFGKKSIVYNISQTDFIKPIVSRKIVRGSRDYKNKTQLQRIEDLEKIVNELMKITRGY